MLKKIFASKEVKAVIDVLNELALEFKEFTMFRDVRIQVEKIVLKNAKHITKVMIEQDIKPRRTAYSWINNVSGDMLESGQYHIYRATLSPMGQELLKIFDISTDKLVELGDMDKAKASEQKEAIRKNIKTVG